MTCPGHGGSGRDGPLRPCRAVLPLALMIVAAPGPAAAHWEYTRWGMTQRQVISASRGAVGLLPPAERRAVPQARMEYRAAGEFRSGPLRLSVAFAFDGRNGGLVCVSARGEAAMAAALRARLERLFGPAQERGRDPATGVETLGWVRPDEIDLQIAPGGPVVLLHCARGA